MLQKTHKAYVTEVLATLFVLHAVFQWFSINTRVLELSAVRMQYYNVVILMLYNLYF